MKDHLSKSSNLYCFNPIVTLLTGLVETFFAFCVIALYSKTIFGRIATVILILLAVFQFSEYAICAGDSVVAWSKIGYIAASFLPALGLHLAEIITRKTFFTPLAYALATLITVGIVAMPEAFIATYCTGTFVLFELTTPLRYAFSIYYVLFIALAMAKLAMPIINREKNIILHGWLLAGYCSFIIPTLIVTILFVFAQQGIPSIMCGFAILLALIILFKALPLYHKLQSEEPQRNR